MKISNRSIQWGIPATLILSTVFALVAWTDHPQQPASPQPVIDTIPSKKKYQRDLDKEMDKLEQAREHLEDLRNRDWNKIHEAIAESMSQLDAAKIRLQTEKAIRESLDAEKISRQVQEALARIDFDKIHDEVLREHHELTDKEKKEIKQEIEKAKEEVKALDRRHRDEVKDAIEKAKHYDHEKVEEAIEKAKEEVKRSFRHHHLDNDHMKASLQKARKEIEKAKQDMKGYQEMIYDMEKAELLDTKKDYSIAYRDGKLYINDQLQSPAVTEKYKKYFRESKVTITKKDGDMSIDND